MIMKAQPYGIQGVTKDGAGSLNGRIRRLGGSGSKVTLVSCKSMHSWSQQAPSALSMASASDHRIKGELLEEDHSDL
jgi:hypothetical protein